MLRDKRKPRKSCWIRGRRIILCHVVIKLLLGPLQIFNGFVGAGYGEWPDMTRIKELAWRDRLFQGLGRPLVSAAR